MIRTNAHTAADSLSALDPAEKNGSGGLPHNNAFGYTLMELMVAISIIGVLTAIATPMFLGYRERARTAVAVTDLKHIEDAIASFFVDNVAYPDTLAEVGMDDLKDPWGNAYQYLRIDGGETTGVGKQRKDHFMVPVNSDFDLYSMGPDSKSASPFTAKASRDDIVRAFDGGYYGKVSEM